jgi:uncharacterized protein (TIGR03546 family)
MREALIRLLTSTSSRHRPWQISAAVAVGVMGAVLPKSSLLFYAVLVVVYCLPVHLPLALMTMLALSPLASWFHPQIGQLGVHALVHTSWSQFWLRLDAYPLIPWLGLHNSLVNGASLVGLTLTLPTYAATRLAMVWLILDSKTEMMVEAKVEEMDEEMSMAQAEVMMEAATSVLPRAGVGGPHIKSQDTPQTPVTTLSQIERILASYDALEDNGIDGSKHDAAAAATSVADADQVIRRAALMVSAVDDILSVLDSEQRTEADPPVLTAPYGDSETSISIVRGDQPATLQDRHFSGEPASCPPQLKGRSDRDAAGRAPEDSSFHSGIDSGLQHRREPQTSNRAPALDGYKPGSLTSQHTSHVEIVPKPMLAAGEERRTNIREVREGEVLRNLLNHLRELKEKV